MASIIPKTIEFELPNDSEIDAEILEVAKQNETIITSDQLEEIRKKVKTIMSLNKGRVPFKNEVRNAYDKCINTVSDAQKIYMEYCKKTGVTPLNQITPKHYLNQNRAKIILEKGLDVIGTRVTTNEFINRPGIGRILTGTIEGHHPSGYVKVKVDGQIYTTNKKRKGQERGKSNPISKWNPAKMEKIEKSNK
ncbi:hypothetical protein JW758_05210 [Candidatus Peregrinibacteria bacterium]|nr:hypothetical protein [Candidatus Peregrinibacteria bacterium]